MAVESHTPAQSPTQAQRAPMVAMTITPHISSYREHSSLTAPAPVSPDPSGSSVAKHSRVHSTGSGTPLRGSLGLSTPLASLKYYWSCAESGLSLPTHVSFPPFHHSQAPSLSHGLKALPVSPCSAHSTL